MAEKYFNKFPTITYSNTVCRDLTKRVTIDADIKGNVDLYYPVEIQSGFRPDALAEAYYEDAEMDWLIYLTNKIVDPYYEWYISEINFDEFIIDKYTSVANAQEHVAYYRNNWYEDEAQLTPQTYNESIDMSWRKYYEPLFTPTNSVYSYRRKREDWVMNTNRILQYTIDTNPGFVNGEIVDLYYSGEVLGTGEVITSNNTALIIKNVSGNTEANTTFNKIIVGETSEINAIANAVYLMSECFSVDESRFWSSVSYYDMEVEKWEARKHVEVIDEAYGFDVANQLREKLQPR